MDSLYSSSSFSFLIRPLLAALHELLEGGLPPTAALEELLGLRHNQVPCVKNVNTSVEVDRRCSTHCWHKRRPNETHVSHEKIRFDGKSTSQKHVESRVQSRSGCTAQIVARFRAHLSNGHTMEYVWQDAHTDASTRNKAERPVPNHGSLGVKCHVSAQRATRVVNVCTRTKIYKSNVSIMGQIQEGRLAAAGEKSLRKALPRMQCDQPCRQSRSRRVLSSR